MGKCGSGKGGGKGGCGGGMKKTAKAAPRLSSAPKKRSGGTRGNNPPAK